MPAVSQSQQRFMGMELNKAEHGEPTKTKMSIKQLREFASTKRRGLPVRASRKMGR